ncbi:MAG: AMP-binding protein [Actinomycetota bacterium]|jgi:acyl-CoA synthetase (AMP-forming)/AMP-acid ligase II|nr:AMP-binding protein [Actinomycetota bacterium]
MGEEQQVGSVDQQARHANLIRRVNVGDTLTRSAWRDPTKLAVVDGSRRLDYRTLNSDVNRLANALAARGYLRGDVLALVSGNSLEFLLTYYACAKLGVICVPINLGWSTSEVAYVLQHSRAKGLVVEAQALAALEGALAEARAIRDVVVAPGTAADWAPATGDGREWASLAALLDGASADEPEAYVEDRDALSYLYTSGTTAAPKGVVSSHLAVYLESTTAVMDFRVHRDDRAIAVLPLFHTAQLNGFTTPVLLMGGTVVLQRGFDAGRLLEVVEAEQITRILALPMMYRAILDHPDLARRDLSSLRLAAYAMAPMPDEDLRRAMEALSCDFTLGFGQTEMNPLTTVFQPEQQLSHPGSVGTPVVNVQVAIADDDGRLLDQGESGEIVYRGPHAMEGYLRDEEATASAFAHGWFHSGDIGHFDADGVLWFEDRKKDVIKTGGENVASIEVERALYDTEPRIHEAVVIGLPHPRWGEAVTAVVVPRPGETVSEVELQDKLKARLAGFKVPKAVVVAGELPHTSTGKVQKQVLRDRFRDLYEKR